MHKRPFRIVGIVFILLTTAPFITGFAGGQRWTADEMAVLSSLSLSQLPPAPRDPSNAVDGQASAAALGKRLFNDARLSRNQAVSCASCHAPDKQFQDGLPVGQGVGVGVRRTMLIVGAGRGPWLFWDGRKDSLWAQALGPMEDAVEHGGNRTRFAQLLQANYKAEYEAIFGKMPELARLPSDAGPLGSAEERSAWAAMRSERRNDVSHVFANMGKVIAAYENTLAMGESRFDQYVRAVVARDTSTPQSLTDQEVSGLRLFIGKGQCSTCHNGPLLTDQHFHNTGIAPRDTARPDRGRAAGVAKVQRDEFNCLGPFSDAKAEQCKELRFIVTDDPALEGAFKTPGLRNVALRPPYMHAGQLATLEEVIAHYVKAPDAAVGHTELVRSRHGHSEREPIQLSEREIKDLAAFLRALSAPIVEDSQP